MAPKIDNPKMAPGRIGQLLSNSFYKIKRPNKKCKRRTANSAWLLGCNFPPELKKLAVV